MLHIIVSGDSVVDMTDDVVSGEDAILLKVGSEVVELREGIVKKTKQGKQSL